MADPDPPAGAEAVLPVSFFKMIVETKLQRIKMPKKFIRIYGSDLPNPVFLKTPNGTLWKVVWTKLNDRDVWFEEGWKEFAKHYSLEKGCLVVFTYEGTSKFDVVIHGKNNVEIDYPERYTSDEENDDDDDDDDEEEFYDYDYDDDDDDDEVEFLGELPVQEQMRDARTSSLNQPRTARAKEVARVFISNNPFVTLFIKQRDLKTYRKSLHCLRGYVENEEKVVVLRVGEKEWRVRMLCHHEPPKLHRQFSAGWKTFAHENELQPGDVCILELINREDPVTFQVHVTKHNS